MTAGTDAFVRSASSRRGARAETGRGLLRSIGDGGDVAPGRREKSALSADDDVAHVARRREQSPSRRNSRMRPFDGSACDAGSRRPTASRHRIRRNRCAAMRSGSSDAQLPSLTARDRQTSLTPSTCDRLQAHPRTSGLEARVARAPGVSARDQDVVVGAADERRGRALAERVGVRGELLCNGPFRSFSPT